jgi:hypothetical protein
MWIQIISLLSEWQQGDSMQIPIIQLCFLGSSSDRFKSRSRQFFYFMFWQEDIEAEAESIVSQVVFTEAASILLFSDC